MGDPLLTFRELLDYTAAETARWEVHFQTDPAALDLPFAEGVMATVGGLVRHVFAVELRHTQRLHGRPVPGYEAVPESPPAALFAAGREARAGLEAYLAAATPEDLDVVLEFDTLTGGRLRLSRRKLAAHVLLHGVRHWAQLASHLRAAGRPGPGRHDIAFSDALG